MNPLLLPGDWLIQPDALRSMALAARAFNDRGGPPPQSRPQSPLLTVQDGIGSVSIEGPTPSAQVGSIGVVQAVIDDSAAPANEGIKVEVFAVANTRRWALPARP